MKLTSFKDMHDQEIQVSLSGSGDYRVYCNKNDATISCLLLNKYQARILINSLEDLIQDIEDE